MRLEELSNHVLIKQTDTVEAYLLNLVQSYFKQTSVASPNSKEYIIQKAVNRMREDLTLEGLGVLSIKLPDDEQPRTGAVNISLEELGGEPKIEEKKGAFNVNFGNLKDTACEGNDPRLSDKRMPIYHEHNIEEVIGLEGRLSTLEQQITKANGLKHNHDNMDILNLLIYSGTKNKIDLAEIETIEPKIIKLVDKVNANILGAQTAIENGFSQLNSKITQIDSKITEVKDYILNLNNTYETKLQNYVSQEITKLQNDLSKLLENYLSKKEAKALVDIANKAYTFVDKQEIPLGSYITLNEIQNTSNFKFTIDIAPSILSELNKRKITINDCLISIKVKYYKDQSTIVYEDVPFIIINDYSIVSVLEISTNYNSNSISCIYNTFDNTYIPSQINNATLICKIYSPQEVILDA